MGKQLQVIEKFRGLDQTIKPFANPKNYNYLAACRGITIKNDAAEKVSFPTDCGLMPAMSGVHQGAFKCSLNGKEIHLEVVGGNVCLVEANTRTVLGSGFDINAFYDFNVFMDKIIICNGVDKVQEYNGTTFKEVTFIDPNDIWLDARPQGSVVYANKIVYWGNPTDPNVIYFPIPNSYDNFDNTTHTADAIRVNSGKAGKVIGIYPFIDDKLIIFQENATLYMSGSEPVALQGRDPFKIRSIATNIGCVSHRTIVDVGSDLYFVSDRGLESLKAVQSYGDVKIGSLFDKIIDDISSFLSSNNKKYTFCCYDKQNKRIQVYFRSVDDRTYRWSYDITPDPINYVTAMAEDIDKSIFNETFTSGAVIDNIVWLGSKDGKTYRIKGKNYTADPSFLELHYYPTKNGLEILKNWEEIVLFVETDTKLSNLKIEWRNIARDKVSDTFSDEIKGIGPAVAWNNVNWNQFIWNECGQAIIRIKKNRGLGKGKAIKLRFSNNVAGEHFRIRRLELYYSLCGLCK